MTSTASVTRRRWRGGHILRRSTTKGSPRGESKHAPAHRFVLVVIIVIVFEMVVGVVVVVGVVE